jgi:pyridoxal phosphate enzyme (YggS family)
MNLPLWKQIKERYDQVLERIGAAARSVDRDPTEIRLVVVTKSHPVEVVEAVACAGARILGENYVEEAIPKMATIDDKDVEWHMIGHIQSRKTRDISAHFAWVHSLDRIKIARLLDQAETGGGKRLPVLLECKVSPVESKFGFPIWDKSRWPQIAEEVAAVLEFSNLEVHGLMTMPPWDQDPELSRPYYQQLNLWREYLVRKFPHADWNELSIGMSNDYEIAIQEGATFVRIGTAILGQRT